MTSSTVEYYEVHDMRNSAASTMIADRFILPPPASVAPEGTPLSAQLHPWEHLAESGVIAVYGEAWVHAQIFEDFIRKLTNGMMAHDPALDKLLSENFWDL